MLRVLVIALVLGVASAFPWGAPESVCTSMKPGHLWAEDQSAPNPFSLYISSTSYQPGEVIKGKLNGTANLKGFLIECRSTSSEQEGPIGEFIGFDNTVTKHVCGKGAITHKSNKEKEEISFVWKAPATPMGNLIFRASVVEYYQPFTLTGRYWQGIFSDVLKSGQ